MAILNHGSTIRTADGGQSTTTIVTASNIGTYGVAANSPYFIGTTQNVFNRASGAQTLTGVSIDGNAATVTNGVYTTGAQTIGGTKTFSDGVIVNGATYYTFNKPTTTNYQTVALFGSASAGLFLTTDSAIIGVGAYYNAGWIATATSGRQIDFAGGNFTFGAFSGATVGGAANWGTVAQLSSAGVFSATGDFRAPIFYDSNNTSYYLDAASTSSFNALNLASTLAINGGDGIRVFKSPASSVTSQIYWANGANTIAYNWQIDENNNAAMWGYGGTAWAKLLTVTSGGGVGIGTSTISQKLNISGNIMVAPVSSSWAEGLSFTMPTASTWGGLRWRREVANADGNHYIGYTGLDSTDDLVFGSNNGGTQINNNIRITKAGLVGIGTAPSQKFHVSGIGYSDTDFRAPIFYDSANTAYYLDPANTGTSLLVAGNVGIGTTNPVTKLHVEQIQNAESLVTLRNDRQDLADVPIFGISAQNSVTNVAKISFYRGGGGNSGYLTFSTKFDNASSLTEKVRIDGAGNVGIGTTSPTQLLDVRGNIKLGGDNSGNYVYYVTDIERTIVRTTRSDVTQEGLLRSDGWGNFTFSNNIGVGLSLGTGYGVGSVGSGIVYANGSVRAPIFYDSNNTSYYLDPASTSNLVGLTVANTITGSISGNAATATTSLRSTIEDTRAAQRTPNDYDDYRASYEFTNAITGLGDWHSAFTLQGWHNGYAAWQIIGPASTSAHENFYLRSGVNTTWNAVRTILHSGNYNSYSPTLTGTGASGSWGINITGSSASSTGNAATATTLQTARNINGTSFNGSAAITTATWGTARTLTIGSTGKSVDGSAGVSWSLAEIGAAATNQTMFIGTTSVAINRASASQTLTGVSIDGNAATASNATQFGGEANTNFMRGLAGGTEANINNYTDNGFRTVAYTGHGKGLLSFNVGSSIGTVQHEYFYNIPTNGWRVRNKTDNTTWSSWGNIVMTDTNQGALTGTVITTGNSSGLSPTFSNLYAAIFYDAADSTYYLDPANTTLSLKTRSSIVINNASAPNNLAMLNIGYSGSGETRAIDIQGGWSGGENKSITFTHASSSTNIVAQINAQHNGPASRLRWGKLYHGGDSSTYTMELISESTTSAYLTVAGSVRAPIFYDSNDTNYYIDPASTSVINVLQFAANTAQIIGNTTSSYGSLDIRGVRNGWRGIHFNAGGNAPHLMFDGSANGGIYYETGGRWASYYSYGNNCWGFGTSTTNSAYNLYAPTGVYSGGRVDGTIFYDSNDTTYYVDPNSLSNIRHTIFHIGSNLVGATGVGVLFDGNYTTGQYRHRFRKYDDGNGLPLYIDYASATANSFTTIARFGGGGTYNPFSVYGTADASGDFRAPIFYDSNNTSYYVDPASTSILNNIRTATISAANHGLTCVYYGGGATPTNGYLITTNIDYSTFNMPTVIIEGYAYGSAAPIHLEIVWYAYNNSWTNLSYTNLGAWDPGTISIGTNASGKVCLHLSGLIYYGRFNVRCIYDQGNVPLEGWTVTDATTSALTRVTTISKSAIVTNITGNSATTTLATKATRANGNFYIDDNYGNTVVGLYSASRYQGVFAMGDSYKLPADGTTTGNLYGIAWSHPNAGGAAGNLSTHGALILENGSYIAAISSSIRCTADMRTPIYYDSNNTAYYIDPASTSNLNSLTVAGGNATIYRDLTINGGTSGNFGNRIIVQGTATTYTLQDGNLRPTVYLTGAYPVLTLNHTITNNANHGPTIQFAFNGLTTGGSTSRQIVVGPNGTGTCLDFGFSGGGYGSNSDYNPHNGIAGYSGVTPMRLFSNGLLLGSTGAYPNNITSTSYALDVRGTGYASSDFRSPVFYDSDDTNFYANPAGESKFNYLRLTNNNALYFTTTGVAELNNEGNSTNVAFRMIKSGSSNSDGNNYGVLNLQRTNHTNGATNAGASIFFELKDSGGTIREYAGLSGCKTEAGAAGGRLIFHRYARTEIGYWDADQLFANASMRSPIFYDSDNTGYYLNPAGSSNLSVVTAGDYYTGGWFRSNVSGYGIYNQVTGEHFYSDDASYWNVASSSTVQGIRLRTGGYGGTVRGYFYADNNNDVGLLNNSGNWRVRIVGGDYVLFDGSSVRAQIFYDSNDTNYYVNPASTSVLNSLTVTDANLELYKSQTVDMSNTTTYSTSNYYPVTIPVPTEGCIIQIQNNLNSNVPSWATHGSGFTLNLKWRTNGFGWGTTQVRRIIDQYFEQFTNQTICGGITQMGNSSTEVVWLRGGGQYYFKFSRNLSATAQSATYTVSSQSVSPTSTAQNTIWSSAGGSSIQYNDQTISTTNMYTPVLYDWNNSAYYVDPASTSNLVGLTVANTITGSITGNAGGSSASCTGNAATATRTSGQSGYPHAGTGMFAFYNWGGSDGGTSAPSASTYTTGLSVGSNPGDQAYGFQIANNMWNTGLWTRNYNSGFGSWIRLLDSSNYVGYSAFTGNVDGTQFRDANNTAYYIDPASTSNLVGLTVANTITGAVSGNAGSVTINYNNDSNSTYQMLWGSGNNVYGTAGVYLNPSTDYVTATSFNASDWFRSSGATGWYNSTYGGGIYMTDTTWVRTYNSKYFYCDTIIQAGSDMRSPVYYDANDTAYYVDAASTSNLLLVKTRNTFGERVAVSATASTTINTQYNVTELTLAATITTLTLSNIQASGTVHMWTIVTVGGGVGYSITWPAAVKWPGGTAPTLTTTSNKRDIYQFVTYDGGTTIFAIIVGQNL